MHSTRRRAALTCVITLIAAATASLVGTAPAEAAAVPTLAVAASGTTNWELTYLPGARAGAKAECTISVGSHRVLTKSTARTATLKGKDVRPGRFPVRVRCGRSVSPTLWIYSQRGQINDIGTWASNLSAGVLGI